MEKTKLSEIAVWKQGALEEIEQCERMLKTEPDHTLYNTLAAWNIALGQIQFLETGETEAVRQLFLKASELVRKSFSVVYNVDDPDYPINPCSLEEITAVKGIDGFHAAFMAGDFEAARKMADWLRFSEELPDAMKAGYDQLMNSEESEMDGHEFEVAMLDQANDYALALKNLFVGNRAEAKVLTEKVLKSFQTGEAQEKLKQLKEESLFVEDAHFDYEGLCATLLGILDNNEERFNQGLEMLLRSHQEKIVEEDILFPMGEFFAASPLAMANLGIHQGLAVSVQSNLLPEKLIIG